MSLYAYLMQANKPKKQAIKEYGLLSNAPGGIGMTAQVSKDVLEQGLMQGLLSNVANVGTPMLVQALLGNAAGGVVRSATKKLKDQQGYDVSVPSRLYRGEDANTGKRTATMGYGLYTTPDKSKAKNYGTVKEIPVDAAFPSNPLVLSVPKGSYPQNVLDDWAIEKSGSKNLREFNEKYGRIDKFLKSLGYDGVFAGDEVVKY